MTIPPMDVRLANGIDAAPAARGHVVVIDVIRAFTTAAFAFEAGAERIVLVSQVEDALALRRRFAGCVLVGEIGGRPIPGFDFGNSPHDVETAGRAAFVGRTVVHRTGNGTQGVVAAARADAVYLGSLVVASATARLLVRRNADPVTLLAMGSASGADGREDVACRTYLADVLAGRAPDREAAVRDVRESRGGRMALDPSIDWISPQDLDCTTSVDRFDFAMPVGREDGLLVARRVDLPRG